MAVNRQGTPITPRLTTTLNRGSGETDEAGRNRITVKAFLRKRAFGNYWLCFKWKGKSYIKALGTDNEQIANEMKKDVDERLACVRRDESALASKLLADGRPIVDVLIGSERLLG